jgi:hypothetical protein
MQHVPVHILTVALKPPIGHEILGVVSKYVRVALYNSGVHADSVAFGDIMAIQI